MLWTDTIDVHCGARVKHGDWRRGTVARVRVLVDEMWLAASRSQGELGDQYYSRPGVHPARWSAAVQPAERAAPRLHRHEGREPTASDGAGTRAPSTVCDLHYNYYKTINFA